MALAKITGDNALRMELRMLRKKAVRDGVSAKVLAEFDCELKRMEDGARKAKHTVSEKPRL